ncbi:MAG: carotenoid 1,2-hydratase [Gammaproteobacteria bacterium]|nr:carotenoid 1,2-hydratase [Gammaproteobacteria bacterium]
MSRIVLGIVCLLAIGFMLADRMGNQDVEAVPTRFLSGVLPDSTDSQDYDHASPDTVIQFPRDHGAHEGFRHEWWYFTGNLQSQEGREFGYQLTFFRFAHASRSEIQNAWNNDQTWMAHLAVSDIESERFFLKQDMSRQSLGLAGVKIQPFRVWLHNWHATGTEPSEPDRLALDLNAEGDGFSIDLSVKSKTAPVLQGENGYSRKGHSGKSASHYYSYPDMETSGQIRIDGKTFEVFGTTWMDREWSSALLQENQTGWDWFALHLDNGKKIMAFQMRQEQGEAYRHAVLIDPRQEKIPLDVIEMIPTRSWISPDTGIEYPIGWKLGLQSVQEMIALEVDSLMPNQEMDLLFRYYEGAVEVRGQSGNEEISGRGYMELTGYN